MTRELDVVVRLAEQALLAQMKCAMFEIENYKESPAERWTMLIGVIDHRRRQLGRLSVEEVKD